MKNVFFALAFMLIGSLSFASSNEIVEPKEDIKVEIVNSSDTIQTDNYVVSDYSSNELFGCTVGDDYLDSDGNVVGFWILYTPWHL